MPARISLHPNGLPGWSLGWVKMEITAPQSKRAFYLLKNYYEVL